MAPTNGPDDPHHQPPPVSGIGGDQRHHRFQAIPRLCLIGGPNLLRKFDLEQPEELNRASKSFEQDGHALVYLIEGDKVLAVFAVADAVRTESKEAVQLLVSRIVHLSRATNRKMVQNLWWAAGYNIAAIALAAGVLAWAGILLAPAAGAILMSASTVIVAVNAQLLRRFEL